MIRNENDAEEEGRLALYANQWSIRKIPRTPAWDLPASLCILYREEEQDEEDGEEDDCNDADDDGEEKDDDEEEND